MLKVLKAISADAADHEAAIFQGMEHLFDSRTGFAWADLCELYRRSLRLIPNASEDYAERMVARPPFAPLLRLVGLVANPVLLYLVGNHFVITRMFRPIEVQQRRIDDKRIELNLRIPLGYEDSPEFFRVTRAVLQALPRGLGLPAARVDLKVDPMWGRYVIHPPPSMTIWARSRRAFAAFFLGRSALEELTRQQDILNEQVRELTLARNELEHVIETKQRFLSVINHELRKPLKGLIEGASALRKSNRPNTSDNLIESIQRSSEAMEHVVLDLLEYTRLEEASARPQPVEINVDTLFEDTIHFAHSRSLETGVRAEIQRNTDPRTVRVDAPRFQQIARHLVDNAFKFTPRGLIRLEIRLFPEPKSELFFAVSDTGPGVEPAKRDEIFSLFGTRDASSPREPGSSGIGLPLSLRLAELLGGTLTLEEGALSGACFVVRIPCETVEEDAPVVTAYNTCPRLLVVDDNRVNRRVLRHILERLRWEVFEAANGQEAVRRVQERSFAAIFMDCAMPVMDGFEATREIRRLVGQATRIIATTAYVTDDDRARCFAAGMNDFLPKPVKGAIIAQALERWTGAASPKPNSPASAAG